MYIVSAHLTILQIVQRGSASIVTKESFTEYAFLGRHLGALFMYFTWSNYASRDLQLLDLKSGAAYCLH